ncbi:MAG: 2-amino-4-hydroxy-6-hydroxymethyldihydropteridine diphosphokinase [Deltaproteobacteria bacterium]|nr:2-amino-4-hydroxy-6-hydroxymethyldihydropteridine diphosphokinase [Deltaproteobacteria bacterium]
MLPAGRIPCRRLVLGLGSNLGDRGKFLANATALIAGLDGVEVRACSSIVETPPAGGPPQADYLNAALLVVSSLGLDALISATFAIERQLGRVRPDPIRWGPRTIDIDLLWCEGEASDATSVLVPHPRLRERPFALQPLLEVAPDACDPRTGERYDALPAARVTLHRTGELRRPS